MNIMEMVLDIIVVDDNGKYWHSVTYSLKCDYLSPWFYFLKKDYDCILCLKLKYSSQMLV